MIKSRLYGSNAVGGSGGGGGASVITVLNTDIISNGNVGAAETTVYNYLIPANTLSIDNQSIYGKSAGQLPGSVNNRQIKLKLNGVLILDTGIFTAPDDARFVLDFQIIREGAALQRCWARLVTNIGGFDFASYVALTENLGANLALTITAQATVDNEITVDMTKVFLENA